MKYGSSLFSPAIILVSAYIEDIGYYTGKKQIPI